MKTINYNESCEGVIWLIIFSLSESDFKMQGYRIEPRPRIPSFDADWGQEKENQQKRCKFFSGLEL